MSQPPLLAVEDLRVGFSTRQGAVEALHGISLTLDAGETLGIVGESGSGKSVTAMSIMRLLDRAGRITGGRILLRGEDLAAMPRRRLRALRGSTLSMIFQNPREALNPIRTVGLQLGDALNAHRSMLKSETRERALDLLQQVRIRDPERRLAALPHKLSGGMCQRVMIAMAIACEPALLIADEPTTGLDVTTQKTVMDLLAAITRERGMALILITHDLGLAARYCRRIAVMEQGRIVEEAGAASLFARPTHAYTRRLIAASPTATSTLASLTAATGADAVLRAAKPTSAATPLLEVRDLAKRYGETQAVDGVSFTLARGESLGLVGESGSGKSTISRLVCRLVDQSAGDILFDGAPIGATPAATFHQSPFRRRIQIVFQDPGGSLNPRFTAFDSIADPLIRLTGLTNRRALAERVTLCAERAGLSPALLTRFPHQLSGGQKARVGIARAISIEPDLLVLDEPTAALDVSVQAVVLQLLDRLRHEQNMAYLFVSHDLNVVRMICERTIVLRQGSIVEEGRSTDLFHAPRDPYTVELVAAIPQFTPGLPTPSPTLPRPAGEGVTAAPSPAGRGRVGEGVGF